MNSDEGYSGGQFMVVRAHMSDISARAPLFQPLCSQLNGPDAKEASRPRSYTTECFFFSGTRGPLLAMHYMPIPPMRTRANLVYVHPFGHEMLHSRHAIAAICRKLAEAGRGVLAVDSYGCGDSCGEAEDAQWEIWRDDLRLTVEWLHRRSSEPVSLWALRFGALLAMDYARSCRPKLGEIILWQPLLRGDMVTRAFTQLPTVADALQRDTVDDGDITNVFGPNLTPALATAIEKLDLAALGSDMRIPIRWTVFAKDARQTISPAVLNIIARWRSRSVPVSSRVFIGGRFWMATEKITGALAQQLLGELE